MKWPKMKLAAASMMPQVQAADSPVREMLRRELEGIVSGVDDPRVSGIKNMIHAGINMLSDADAEKLCDGVLDLGDAILDFRDRRNAALLATPEPLPGEKIV